MSNHEGVGAPVKRKEDSRFLLGEGQYVADFAIPGMYEVAFLRSPVAHARINDIQIPEHLSGKVFTAEHLTAVRPIKAVTLLPGFKLSTEPILAADKVRYVGEPIAMCLGRTRAEAEDLVAELYVDYDELPVAVDAEAALADGAPLVHDEWGDNLFIEIDTEENFNSWLAGKDDAALIKVTRELRTGRQCIFPMEGRGVVAYDDRRLGYLTVISSTQMPHIVQTGLAECLGLSESGIRVIAPDVGGGFGYKGLLLREEVALAWLARERGIPVRWLEDCREHLSANADCREHAYRITGYADREGRLLALDCEAVVNAGAYSIYPTSSALEASQIASLLPGPYDFHRYRCKASAVATNKPPIIPYRGVARPGVCFALETIMDGIAYEAGLEPYEVRRRNLVRADQMPYTNVVGKHFDSGDYPECLLRAVKAIDVDGVRARQRQGEPDGRLLGVGISFYCEQGALGTGVLSGWGRPVVPGYEQATARLTADGQLEVSVGTHSHGQGHETTYAQIAHEVLGLPLSKIKILQGDTLYSPFSTGTYASRSIVMGGGAVTMASRELSARIKHIGAWLLQAKPDEVEVTAGTVTHDGASVSFEEIAHAWYLEPQHLPPDVDKGGLEVTSGYRAGRDSGTFSYAAHAVTVLVDPETGVVEILNYVVVEDGGTLINPMIVEGQVQGGTAQGIGEALYEDVPYSPEGQPLASTLLDYVLPGAPEIPILNYSHMVTPSPHTEFGAKGIGEGGAVGPPAALASAVNDALRPLKVQIHELPMTPDRILAAILEGAVADEERAAS